MSDLDFGKKPGIDFGNKPGIDDVLPDARRHGLMDAEDQSGEESFDATLRPQNLDEFVGQEHVRQQLRVFIDAAVQRGEALDHALFAGPPGLGKCVTADTLMFTPYGMVPIGSFGDHKGESWQPITRQVAGLYGVQTADYFYNNGVGATVKITTGSGYSVEGTPNHPVLVRDAGGTVGFRRLGEIGVDDRVAVRLGAQIFGKATAIHVEHVPPQTLDDPATVPDSVTAELSQLLGMLLTCGRISPKGDGVVVTAATDEIRDELIELMHEVFCLSLESFGDTANGERLGQRSKRVATFLRAMGATEQGFSAIPPCIYTAPRLAVAEFMRGVFFGVEAAPTFSSRHRVIVQHLQLILANFGIESRVSSSDSGWKLDVAAEPSSYETFDSAIPEYESNKPEPPTHEEYVATHGAESVAKANGDALLIGNNSWFNFGSQRAVEVGDANVRTTAERDTRAPIEHVHREAPLSNSDLAAQPSAAEAMSALAAATAEATPAAQASRRHAVGFGVTPAGILVALPNTESLANGYRRGSARSMNISAANVSVGSSVEVAMDDPVPSAVSVAEVEPYERGRALTRERMYSQPDARALAVRTVSSALHEDEAVEIVWESIASVEPGHAYTCDVSVPEGHTFIGNGIVCHNTTLASVVARELGSTMHQTSGPALEKKADVAAILTSLGPRDVLFIDEIHRLNTSIEEVLYSAMEDYQIDIVLGQGPAARTLRLELEPFTLVGATTRTGLLTTPLRDRFGLIQRLEYYDIDSLTQIVQRSASILGMDIDVESAGELASRSRGTPRIANRLLKRVRDVAQVRGAKVIGLDIAQEALDLVDIDAIGLDRIDRSILESIHSKFSGGPVGLSTLAIAIGEERHTLEDVYEPFLLQQGLIQRTPRGRILTTRGRRHIGVSEGSGGMSEDPSLFSL